jgi:hypothetical protein
MSPLPHEILAFFDRYRDAFNRLDADAIAHLFAVPSGLLSGSTYVHWPDFASIHRNMLELCELYRSQGYDAARYEVAWGAALGTHAGIADLAWTIERREGLEPWRFHTAYTLTRGADGWRILLCTAYEERLGALDLQRGS